MPAGAGRGQEPQRCMPASLEMMARLLAADVLRKNKAGGHDFGEVIDSM